MARLAILRHPCRAWLAALLAAGLAGCAALPAGTGDPAAAAVSGDMFIVVAVADRPEARASAGAAVRGGYGRSAGYAASGGALADADALAAEHGLVEVKAWTIPALNWRCMLFQLPAGKARAALLQQLGADARVRLAQPLNDFETLAAPATGSNDPYLPLQSGFAAIDAAGAHRQARGEGVTVAVIDSQVDTSHPELQGRVAASRDFVGRGTGGPIQVNLGNQGTQDNHGTQVAGVIAAATNNGLGIAGVAPAARLLALRSCWAGAPGQPSRCNSFTLAQGLAAAMAAGADVINFSLAGPTDPLLQALAQRAMAGGAVIVAALPASGQREGFPSAVPGVLVAAASEAGAAAPGVLAAPGRQVLTLAAGGGYDYASGSSMASAHLAGAVALLRSRDRSLPSTRLAALLASAAGQPIDACRALLRLSPGSPGQGQISPGSPGLNQVNPEAPAGACAARPSGSPLPGPSAAGWPVQAPAPR